MLATTTQIKSHLSITSTTSDTILAQLLDQVEAVIENETGIKTVDSTTYADIDNEYRDSDGSLVITTRYKPIRTLDALKYRDTDNTYLDYTSETLANVVFDAEKNEIYPLYVVAGAGKRMLKISYTAGYKTAEVPLDLQLCAILMVCGLFNQRNTVGLTSQSILGLSLQISNEDALYVAKVLIKYKNVIVV